MPEFMTAPFGTAPICDGFEAMDRRIGVIGSLDAAGGKALFLRTYSPGVMVFETVVESFGDIRPALKKAGVHSVSRPVRVACNGSTVSVTTQDGTAHEVDTLYPARGCTVRSDLAAALGASANETGNLLVDQVQQTTVEGLYAAGDVASDLHQINVATAHAAIAATNIHNKLARHCVSDACRSSRAWRKRAHPRARIFGTPRTAAPQSCSASSRSSRRRSPSSSHMYVLSARCFQRAHPGDDDAPSQRAARLGA